MSEQEIDWDALNEAGWKFLEAYSDIMKEHVPGTLFNSCKMILKPAIEEYLRVAKENSE